MYCVMDYLPHKNRTKREKKEERNDLVNNVYHFYDSS